VRAVPPLQPSLTTFGLLLALLIALVLGGSLLVDSSRAWHDEVPLSTADTVPMPLATAEQALNRGEAVLLARFGRTVIDEESPLTALFHDGVWTVSGTFPRGSLGGTGTVELSAKDGRSYASPTPSSRRRGWGDMGFDIVGAHYPEHSSPHRYAAHSAPDISASRRRISAIERPKGSTT
jgi:NTF2 fold immunity protein of polymorphic toxin system component